LTTMGFELKSFTRIKGLNFLKRALLSKGIFNLIIREVWGGAPSRQLGIELLDFIQSDFAGLGDETKVCDLGHLHLFITEGSWYSMPTNPYFSGSFAMKGSGNHLGDVVFRLPFQVSIFGQFPEVLRPVAFHRGGNFFLHRHCNPAAARYQHANIS